MRLGILISGRGSNMRSIVQAIKKRELPATVALVLSNKKTAPGLAWATGQRLPTAFVSHRKRERADFEADIDVALRVAKVDLVVLAGFMRILSPSFVNRWRIVNIHPSLLPAFPGLDAQRQALEAGVKVSGCTVHFVDEGTDTGPIIAQTAVPVLDDDTEAKLSARILQAEHALFPAALRRVAEGKA